MQLKCALLLLTLFNYENLYAMEVHMYNEPEHQMDILSCDYTEGLDGVILNKPIIEFSPYVCELDSDIAKLWWPDNCESEDEPKPENEPKPEDDRKSEDKPKSEDELKSKDSLELDILYTPFLAK